MVSLLGIWSAVRQPFQGPSHVRLLLFLCLTTICGLYVWSSPQDLKILAFKSTEVFDYDSARGSSPATLQWPCVGLPGANNVMVSMKTGATAIHSRLPVHLTTTFQCLPNYQIYSDLSEDLGRYHALDILANVSDGVKQSSPEFNIYHKIHKYHDQGRGIWQLSAAESKQAWDLDKWKFLPQLAHAYESMPRANWFVFIEADTFLNWSNTLEWLSRFEDPMNQTIYLGSQAMIGGHIFAHGGSGYILSNAALKAAVELRAQDLARWEAVTRDEWAGDFVVTLLLDAADVNLTHSWPMVQGETPSSLDYTAHHWCFPAVTYHHMHAEEIVNLWHLEQAWISSQAETVHSGGSGFQHVLRKPMVHGDVFEHLIAAEILEERSEWDNLSHDWEADLPSDQHTADQCRSVCSERLDCVQYLLTPEKCKLGRDIRLGRPQAQETMGSGAYVAGWMVNRIRAFRESIEPCPETWIGG